MGRYPGRWIMLRADTAYVDNIATILTQLIVLDSIPLDSINLLQVGLDHPIASFSVYLNKRR